MDAREKFGEHEKCARVARGAAKSNSSFLSALQTSQVIITSYETNEYIQSRMIAR